MKRFFATLILISTTFLGAPIATAQEDVQFGTGTLEIVSGETSHLFQIEIADSAEETTRGLMFRETMAEDHGMLFDFGEPREPAMWMKNTLIPLDMLFLDESGVIVAIAKNAQPHSQRRISPGMPVKGVLELNGGVVSKLKIAPGDVVHQEIFNNVNLQPAE